MRSKAAIRADKLRRKPHPAVNPAKYSKAPHTVLCDPELSASAKCVFFYLCGRWFSGPPEVHMTQLEITRVLGMHRSTVIESLQDLEARGHLEKMEDRGRGYYRLTSPVFSYKKEPV